MGPTTGHSYFGNIDPAFSQEFSVQLNFEQLEVLKNLFPEYMVIPNFLQLKFMENLIPISMYIPLPYPTTWYFSHNFPCDHVASKTT